MVVLAVAMMQKVKVEEIWVAFGTGKRFKYIAIHELHHSLGPRKAITLPFFHAFTGCDTVSYFHSKGKKTCWKIWNLLDEATTSFEALLKNPMTFEAHMPTIERFVVLLYDRASADMDVNAARRILFAQKGREIDKIPPTRDALVLHTKRAIIQTSYCLHQSEASLTR